MNDEVSDLVSLNEQGKVLELCEKYYAPNVIMNSDGKLFASSMREAYDKQKGFLDNVENSEVNLKSRSVNGDVVELIFNYKITTKDNQVFDFVGKHVQTWNNGLVIKEDYFNVG